MTDAIRRKGAEELRTWESSQPEERRRQLESLGEHLGRAMEAPVPPIHEKPFENERLLGQYDDENFRIEMNGKLFDDADPRPALEAYLHEYRHAAQAYEITKSHSSLAREADGRSPEWERNSREYVEPEQSEEAYFRQPLEEDARAFAGHLSHEILRERDHLVRNKSDQDT